MINLNVIIDEIICYIHKGDKKKKKSNLNGI
jgi:hypothetical protein